MSDYRRWRLAGGTYAFTLVTHDRLPLFNSPRAINWLRQSWRKIRRRWQFNLIAVCVLPDHLHAVWQLPHGDADYSTRWKRIKEEFTRQFLTSDAKEGDRRESQFRRGERAIWQRRFWEHVIEDEEELVRCVDYIHYNPVKHGFVHRVKDWKWSSFHRFVKCGDYARDWGASVLASGYSLQE